MKVLLVGQQTDLFQKRLERRGFELVSEEPDLIIAYGGDGTLIGAERLYPGVLKLAIRSDQSCIKCPAHEDEVVLRRLEEGALDEQRLMKIQVEHGDQKLIAMNDIIIRNTDPLSAVRFVVSLNSQPVTEEMIGDGLVACTPFGSTAYFRSITRMVIRVGIGLAFNNCTDLLSHLVFAEHEVVDVDIARGPGLLGADNDPHNIALESGDHLRIGRCDEVARILAVSTLRCKDCRYAHAPRRRY